MARKLKIAVVGLHFGGEFPAIYRDHPDVGQVVLCDQDESLLAAYGQRFGYDNCYADFDALLASDVDAIHLVTGIPSHQELTVKALQAGKHCACTVPMATTLQGLTEIIQAQRSSGKNYMMMETSVYTVQCLYVRSMIAQGLIGNIQYMRGIHFQDMEGWPAYWAGLPPMLYATHAVAPLLSLSQAQPEAVCCHGSGTMRAAIQAQYGNPYPVETATVTFKGKPYVADITRSLFETAHDYVEGFTILSDKGSFEMNVEQENPFVSVFADSLESSGMGSRGRAIRSERVDCPDRPENLPESIRKYTKQFTVLDPQNPHLSIRQGGGHHGSHPHLVHEFIRSIVEARKPAIDDVTAAFWTAVGICAHESAMRGGAKVVIPDFSALSEAMPEALSEAVSETSSDNPAGNP